MRQIPLGAKGSFTLLVQPEHLANRFKDAMLPPVLATPVMIMVMENAALNAVKAYLDPGESAVGTAVDIRHLAPTPVGRQVVGVAEVTKVDGRRIEFSVRATPREPKRSAPDRIREPSSTRPNSRNGSLEQSGALHPSSTNPPPRAGEGMGGGRDAALGAGSACCCAREWFGR